MKLNSQEKKSALILALIFSTRLFGVFLVDPVFSVLVTEENYPGAANLSLVGVAYGIYPLIQSLFQLPFGWLSDKYGRKKMLILGLALFSLGSFVCTMADNIYELIVARAIQGSGATGAVGIAALGDLTRSETRAQAFAIPGIFIGVAFIASFILGPYLTYKIGFVSVFYILAVLGLFSILITLLFFPNIKKTAKSFESKGSILNAIRKSNIKSLMLSGFILAFCLSVFLFIYPLSWKNLGVSVSENWFVYMIAILPGAFFAFPYMRYSERRGNLQSAVRLGFILLLLSFTAYLIGGVFSIVLNFTGIFFFAGCIMYQSLLPAFLTQRVASNNRGLLSGVYSLAGFFGGASGGMLSGFLYSVNPLYPLIMCLTVLMVWFILGLPKQPEQSQIS